MIDDSDCSALMIHDWFIDDDWLGQLHCSPEMTRSKHRVKHDKRSEQQRSCCSGA
jgi:hypothetical protein